MAYSLLVMKIDHANKAEAYHLLTFSIVNENSKGNKFEDEANLQQSWNQAVLFSDVIACEYGSSSLTRKKCWQKPTS